MHHIQNQEYFTVFEGTYAKNHAINRRPEPAAPRQGGAGKAALVLIGLLLFATTATAAITAGSRGHGNAGGHQQHSNFVKLPGIATFEDALY